MRYEARQHPEDLDLPGVLTRWCVWDTKTDSMVSEHHSRAAAKGEALRLNTAAQTLDLFSDT